VQSNIHDSPNGHEMAPRSHLKLLIAIGILTLAIGYLVFSSVQSSSAYYMTIGELDTAGPELRDKKVRVVGTLVGESVQWDARQLKLDFEIGDDSGRLSVTYRGAQPDMFKEGAETIVEGKYVNGLFEATGLFLKCPSKYEAAAPTLTARSSS